jgi:hypothetical protein
VALVFAVVGLVGPRARVGRHDLEATRAAVPGAAEIPILEAVERW